MVLFLYLPSELNGRSKELIMQLMNDGQPQQSKGNSFLLMTNLFCSRALTVMCFGTTRLNQVSFLSVSTGSAVSAFWSCKETSQRTANICTHDQRHGDWITDYWGNTRIPVNAAISHFLIQRYILCLGLRVSLVLQYLMCWIVFLSLPTWSPARWGPGTLRPRPLIRGWRWTERSCPVARWSPPSPQWRASQVDHSHLDSTWVQWHSTLLTQKHRFYLLILSTADFEQFQ